MRTLLLCLLLTALAWPQSRVINLGDAFRNFADRARGQPLARQIQLWTEIVEAAQPALYSELVWTGSWKEQRLPILANRLPKLLAEAQPLQDAFERFPLELEEQLRRFSATLPDARFNYPIIAAPALRFNGRGGIIAREGRVLVFGLDVILQRHDDANVLFSHELFHLYHCERIGITDEVIAESTPLLPLWLEGLAVYFSQQTNPEATRAEVLMQPDFDRLTESDFVWLAQHFPRNGTPPAAWFEVGLKAREDLPERCGYALGLRVVERLAESHSLREMTNWPVARVESEVAVILDKMASP